MKIRQSFTKGLAAVLALTAIVPTIYGQKRWDAPRIVTAYCSGCHGIDGNTQLPYFPKLAGLDPAYAEKKMAAFEEAPSPHMDELFWWMVEVSGARRHAGNVSLEARINMEGVAHAAKPDAVKEATLWYAKQPPAPGRAAEKPLIQQGKELFMHGLPDQKVLACLSCHGPDAQGKGPAPRLAGQNAEYIKSQLAKFSRGDRKHAPEMTTVTRDLDVEQAHAVAAYLQSR